MKLIDKNGRLFGIISVIDICIVLVAALALVVIAPNFLGGVLSTSGLGADQKDVYFTIELSQTSEEFVEKIQVGDAMKDNLRGYYYGVVHEIKVIPSEVISQDLGNAEYVKTIMPEKVDIHVTVKCRGTEDDREITAEGQPIKLGKMMVLKSKGYVAPGYVIALWTE